MSHRSVIVTTSLVTFLITSALWITVFGFLYWSVTSEPPAFQVQIESPEQVTLGEEFDLVVNVTNASESDLTLGSIDVYESLLDGFELISVSPTPSETSHFIGMHTSYFSKKLEAQESFTATYSLKAKEEGLWIGDIDFCTPWENYVTVSKAITVTAE